MRYADGAEFAHCPFLLRPITDVDRPTECHVIATPTNSGPFQLPPAANNASGQMRKAGFELEFAGLTLAQTAEIVRSIFGGEIEVQSTFEYRVLTPAGDFAVEIDTALLKDKKYEEPLRMMGIKLDRDDTQWLEDALLGAASTVVPIEIGAPPMPVDALSPLDELRERLRAAGAKGTRAGLLYVFGMHINPEIPSEDPGVLRDYLRAAILLYPWLKERAEVDVARSISPYINRFPTEYAQLILQEDYPASRERLIDDYMELNPTRNRPVDMLPILVHLDRKRVEGWNADLGLVKARPAFHYRLPNCMVDEEHWTLAKEWNTWVAVERLANDPAKLREMARDYLLADEESFRPFYDKWPGVLEGYMRG
jgi:hypothetical protein